MLVDPKDTHIHTGTHMYTHKPAELDSPILAEKDSKCVFSSGYECLLLMRDFLMKTMKKKTKQTI